MSKHQHICKQCQKEFEDYFETTSFCSRQCYYNYRNENRKYKIITCPICGTEFQQQRENHMFCSVACRVKSTEKKVECTCEYCGRTFNRIESEVNKNKHHYCSEECKRKGMYWSEEDTNLLISIFGTMSYKEMTNIFSSQKSVDELKRRAIYIGLTESRKWTQDDINTLIKCYPTMPIQKVMELIPNKTLLSIRGQARVQNLKSFYYLSRKYTDDENEYLKNNYLDKTDEELAKELNRDSNAIGQHLWVLGLKRPYCIGKYDGLAEYIRSRLYMWKNDVKKRNNYTCAVTGSRSNIVVHHIYGFNLLLTEAIDNLGIDVYNDLTKYSEEQLDQLFEEFLSLQEDYGQYICISETVHRHFHNIYGYGNNTKEQWDEFVDIYYKKISIKINNTRQALRAC